MVWTRLQKTCLNQTVIAPVAIKAHGTPLCRANNPVHNHSFNPKLSSADFFPGLRLGGSPEQGTVTVSLRRESP